MKKTVFLALVFSLSASAQFLGPPSLNQRVVSDTLSDTSLMIFQVPSFAGTAKIRAMQARELSKYIHRADSGCSYACQRAIYDSLRKHGLGADSLATLKNLAVKGPSTPNAFEVNSSGISLPLFAANTGNCLTIGSGGAIGNGNCGAAAGPAIHDSLSVPYATRFVWVDTLGNDNTAVIGNPLRPFRTMDSALVHLCAIGGYGTIFWGYGNYPRVETDWNPANPLVPNPNSKLCDGLNIVGAANPSYIGTFPSYSYSRLKPGSGTIHEGPWHTSMRLRKDFKISNVGFDVGIEVTDAHFGGACVDGLAYTTVGNTWPDTAKIPQPFEANNITNLARAKDCNSHCALFEGMTGTGFNNIRCHGTKIGIVGKIIHGGMSDISCTGGAQANGACLHLKSSPYATTSDVFVTGVTMHGAENINGLSSAVYLDVSDTIGGGCPAPMEGVNIAGVTGDYMAYAVDMHGGIAACPNSTIRDVHVDVAASRIISGLWRTSGNVTMNRVKVNGSYLSGNNPLADTVTTQLFNSSVPCISGVCGVFEARNAFTTGLLSFVTLTSSAGPYAAGSWLIDGRPTGAGTLALNAATGGIDLSVGYAMAMQIRADLGIVRHGPDTLYSTHYQYVNVNADIILGKLLNPSPGVNAGSGWRIGQDPDGIKYLGFEYWNDGKAPGSDPWEDASAASLVFGEGVSQGNLLNKGHGAPTRFYNADAGGTVSLSGEISTEGADFDVPVSAPVLEVTGSPSTGTGVPDFGTASPCASGPVTYIPFRSQGVDGFIPWCAP